MSEFHRELRKQKTDNEDAWHFDATWLTPEDFIREAEKSFKSGTVGDEETTLLKAKFDYIQNIMNDATMPGVQRMIERFLKMGPKKF